MATQSEHGISWTEETWNPVTGCTKVSQGCKFCYAERQFPRVYGRDVVFRNYVGPASGLSNPYAGRNRKFTDIRLHEDRLDQPLRWKRPRRIFVNSMSDLFHDAVPDDFILRVFAVMALARHHTFQVLTKRPERMRDFLADRAEDVWYYASTLALEMDAWKLAEALGGKYVSAQTGDFGRVEIPEHFEDMDEKWPLPNVWPGISAEDQKTFDERCPLLRDTPAAVRWVSLEPLLGPVDLAGPLYALGQAGRPSIHSLDAREMLMPHIDWVVVGGESGPKARPMHPYWVMTLRDQCAAAGVPFHFKQWGRWVPGIGGKDNTIAINLDGEVSDHPMRMVGYPEGGWKPGDMYDFGFTSMMRVGKKRAGRTLDGRIHDEYPDTGHSDAA